jgi:hypothetical protein
MNDANQSKIIVIWRDAIKGAEDRCQVSLREEIEAYLVELLIRFTTKPELARAAMAAEFMRALHETELQRRYSLAAVGDQCLLLSGLFPGAAEKRNVKIRYFVDLGRSAYANISSAATDLYGCLSMQFVMLMDVLQCINQRHVLLPLEAYDLWNEVGSRRALNALREYRNKS